MADRITYFSVDTLRRKRLTRMVRSVSESQDPANLDTLVVSEDLDLFYCKQLADSLQDECLQQKIEHEMRMRDGTAKLLAASRHPHQTLEAAKNLLTSNARMISYMSELQRRKTDQVMQRARSTEDDQVACRGRVAVSEVRIPLMWKDSDHFKNKGDHRRYAVFCLLKIGTEIYDTVLEKTVDRSMTDLSFDDVIVFNEIPAEFECVLEVYSHKLHDDVSMASTPKKIRKKINEFSSNMGRSVGKRLSGMKDDSEIMPNVLLGPRFECIARGSLSLSDVEDCVNSHDLVTDNTASEASRELPLFGTFCCRITAQPQCMTQDTTTGPLHIKMERGWEEYWCCLRGLELLCWYHQDDVADTPCPLIIPITKDTQVSDIPASLTERDFSFSISTRESGQSVTVYTLAARDQGDLTRWWDGLQQHFLDQVMWQQACDKNTDFPDLARQSVLMRKGSQYSSHSAHSDLDLADSDSPMTRILNRLNVDDEMSRESRNRRSKRRSAPPTSTCPTPKSLFSLDPMTDSYPVNVRESCSARMMDSAAEVMGNSAEKVDSSDKITDSSDKITDSSDKTMDSLDKITDRSTEKMDTSPNTLKESIPEIATPCDAEESKPTTVETRLESIADELDSNPVEMESSPTTVRDSSPGIEVESDPTTKESNTAENESEPTENGSDPAENVSDPAENESNSAEIESNTAEIESNTAENESNTAEIESNTAENESNTAENESNTAENESNTAEIESNTAENESNTAENNSNPAENMTEPTENESNLAENLSEPTENRSNSTENDSKSDENESESTENESSPVITSESDMEVSSSPVADTDPVTTSDDSPADIVEGDTTTMENDASETKQNDIGMDSDLSKKSENESSTGGYDVSESMDCEVSEVSTSAEVVHCSQSAERRSSPVTEV